MSAPVLVLPLSPDYELATSMVDAAIREERIPEAEREEYVSVIFTALHLRRIRRGERKL